MGSSVSRCVYPVERGRAMTDAPERITASFKTGDGYSSVRWEGGVCEFDDEKYVRADLYTALEAENKRLYGALRDATNALDHSPDEFVQDAFDVALAALEEGDER